jgi:hypothetical protein
MHLVRSPDHSDEIFGLQDDLDAIERRHLLGRLNQGRLIGGRLLSDRAFEALQVGPAQRCQRRLSGPGRGARRTLLKCLMSWGMSGENLRMYSTMTRSDGPLSLRCAGGCCCCCCCWPSTRARLFSSPPPAAADALLSSGVDLRLLAPLLLLLPGAGEASREGAPDVGPGEVVRPRSREAERDRFGRWGDVAR